MTRSLLALAVGASLSLPGMASGQEAVERCAPYDFTWEAATKLNSGLTSSFINALAQDGEGRLLIGTDSGLFEKATAGEIRALTLPAFLDGARVSALHAAADGSLWVGTEEGRLGRFDGSEWTDLTPHLTRPAEGEDAAIYVIREHPQGEVWIGSDLGLFHSGPAGWRTFGAKELQIPEATVYSLAEAAEGSLWLGTESGLVYFRDGFTELFRFPGYTPQGRNSFGQLQITAVTGLAAEPSGKLWVGTFSGLLSLENGQWKSVSDSQVMALTLSPEGGLWVHEEGGIDYLCDGWWQRFDSFDEKVQKRYSPGYPKLRLASMPDGTLWVGTFHDGLTKFSREPQPAPAHVGYNRVVHTRGAIEDLLDEAETWTFIATNRALAGLRGGASWVMPFDSGQMMDPSFHLTNDGTVWVDTNCCGLGRFQGTLAQWTLYSVLKNLLLPVQLATDGATWAVTDKGAYRLLPGAVWKKVLESPAVPDAPEEAAYPRRARRAWATGWAETADGGIWIATSCCGMFEFREEKWTNWPTADGAFPTESVRSLAKTSDGRLWAATDAGLACWEEGRWQLREPGWGKLAAEGFVRLIGRGDEIWMITADAVARRADDREEKVSEGAEFQAAVRSILKTVEDIPMFISGDGGKTYREERTKQGMRILRAITPSDGSLWLETSLGLLALLDGHWHGFDHRNSALPEPKPLERSILFVESAHGAHWIGTHHGLAVRRGERWEFHTSANGGVPHDYVSSFAAAADGSLWIGTMGGLVQWIPQESP
jgi:ligand-binding sensor domain-containing protein